jgi:hypothetical protein
MEEEKRQRSIKERFVEVTWIIICAVLTMRAGPLAQVQ